jgi:Fe-S-cluster containining protein
MEAGLRSLLPGLRLIADDLAVTAAEDAAAAGSPVSCRKGCGACCRQVAPVLPIEVPALAQALRAMGDEQRSVVVERARTARRQAEAAGLGAALDACGGTTIASRYRLAAAWFSLGIDCPFLDDGACGIYAERPLGCREYLVTSDPTHCGSADPVNVQRVTLRGSASEAYKQAARTAGAPDPRRMLPMVDAVLRAAELVTD